MNPYTKGALFIIRMVAFGFILLGALPLGADYFVSRQHKPGDGIFWIALEILSVLAGLVLLGKSGAIAKKLTEDFDE